MKKNILSILIMMALIVYMLPAAVFASDASGESLPDSEPSSSSEQTLDSEQPSTSEQPAVSEQSSGSEQSVVSEQLAVSEQSSGSEQPAVSEQPSVSEQPAVSEEPAGSCDQHTEATDYKSDANGHWKYCSKCGERMGEVTAHSIGEWRKYDNNQCWKECTVCHYQTDIHGHALSYICISDSYHKAECMGCLYVSKEKPHNLSTKYDADNHWQHCSACDGDVNKEAHNFVEKYDANNHWLECSCGATKESAAHDFVEKCDANNHWLECSCGATKESAAHDFEWVIDRKATTANAGEKHEECSVCGYAKDPVSISKLATHSTSDTDNSDSTSGTDDTVVPNTRDTESPIFWLILLVISGSALAVTRWTVSRSRS